MTRIANPKNNTGLQTNVEIYQKMGRKDASANRGTPVEKYRKDIGKHDYKKSKKEVNMMKSKADMKASAMGIKEVVMILAAFSALVAGIYMFLFWRLSTNEILAN